MSGHTKAPWKSDASHKASNRGDWQAKVMAQDAVGLFRVATVHSGNGDDNTRETCEANARLIAAAPEILNALKNLCAAAEQIQSRHNAFGRGDLVPVAWAAIAKAEGVSDG